LVKRALKGMARSKHGKDQRKPVTTGLLRELLTALKIVCTNDYEEKMFACAFLPAFFGLLRIGELVCGTKKVAKKSVTLINDIFM
jgi:hypothetical protein